MGLLRPCVMSRVLVGGHKDEKARFCVIAEVPWWITHPIHHDKYPLGTIVEEMNMKVKVTAFSSFELVAIGPYPFNDFCTALPGEGLAVMLLYRFPTPVLRTQSVATPLPGRGDLDDIPGP